MATVYILGAGSSKAIKPDAPLNDQLLPEIVKRTESAIKPLKTFLKDFYGIDIQDTTDLRVLPSLEDILSQIDYCLSNSRPLSEDYSLEKLLKLRETLIYGMSKVLKQSMRSGELYWMIKFLKSLSTDDVLISLNYDLIVDNSLMHAKKDPDYGISIRQSVGRLNHPYTNTNEKLKLYKLHGSLNWLYCPACQAIDITPYQKGAVYIFQKNGLKHCPDCGVRYNPVMITPTFLKNYDNNYLKQIWIAAENAIEKADEIVFIGYSLPDADIVLRIMFSRAIYRNRQRILAKSPRITVVDYWNKDDKSPVETRYERIFGKIKYIPDGFQKYVKDVANNTG